ncbi:odorant receptor 131-2-like [Neosynchiropus ocellatus]
MPEDNITAGLGYLERAIFSTMTTIPCCGFLLINITMLFTLRSKTVFCETSRYVLLFNLLLADTVFISISQLLYLLSSTKTFITYPLCGLLIMTANLTHCISPLTLAVMALERYVAVCFPLRHTTLVTVTNTLIAILLIWTASFLYIIFQVILMLQLLSDTMESLWMPTDCDTRIIFLHPASVHFSQAYEGFLFVSEGITVVSCYVGVTSAARSASTNQSSAQKIRNTLLLHLIQLGLSLVSTTFNPLIFFIYQVASFVTFVWLNNILYLCLFISPRCLSSLAYILRDQTIKPILLSYLSFRHMIYPVKIGDSL